MTPENLCKISRRMFKVALYCGVLCFLVLAAVPNPGFSGASNSFGQTLPIIGFALAGIFFLSILSSLIIGFIARVKGEKSCTWVVILSLILIAPILFLLAILLNQ
ncbi:MAG: hypothetical protein KZQ83_10815 [gamma proteobacterium symbiont of Taylorina sp.]|nr:hypothetical protein [gamma proteobacterium symbiont of Taylorina sp.]